MKRTHTEKQIELQARLITFVMEHYFYLKEELTGKLWLLRPGYLANIFSKVNEASL